MIESERGRIFPARFREVCQSEIQEINYRIRALHGRETRLESSHTIEWGEVVARFLRKPSVSPRVSARREPHQREKMAAVPMDPQQMMMLTGAVTSLESALLANKSDPRYARRKVGANLAPQGGTNGRTDRRPASKGCCWLSWMDGRGRGCGKGKWGGTCCSTTRWRPVEKAGREAGSTGKKRSLKQGRTERRLGRRRPRRRRCRPAAAAASLVCSVATPC